MPIELKMIISAAVGGGVSSYCVAMLIKNKRDYVSWGGLLIGLFNIGYFIWLLAK